MIAEIKVHTTGVRIEYQGRLYDFRLSDDGKTLHCHTDVPMDDKGYSAWLERLEVARKRVMPIHKLLNK